MSYFVNVRRQRCVVHEVVYKTQLIYKILTFARAHDIANVPD